MSSESEENITDLPTIDPVEELVAEYVGLKLEHVDITPQAYIDTIPRSLRDEVRERIERYESVRSLIPHALEVFKPPPELLGDFRILGELGRGGAGVVYRAEQISLRRIVALKILPPAAGLSARSVERFLDGAVAAARLGHPNIVSVYTAGETRGILYLAMEYVPGPALSAALVSLKSIPAAQRSGDDVAEILRPYSHQSDAASELFSRFDPRGRSYHEVVLRIGESLADALDACHRLGVLHRDIKPANIILAPDGCPRLMDFGLSRLVSSEAGLTVTGEMLGTPGYLAPEQIDHGLKAATECGDVYSLGATLYECFTGRMPFVEESLSRLLFRIANEEPDPPSMLSPGLPWQFDRVIMTAIARDPARRHPSPAILREDLRALLFGQRPPFACERRRELLRVTSRLPHHARRRGVPMLIAANVVAVVLLVLLWAPWSPSAASEAPSPDGGPDRVAVVEPPPWQQALTRALAREKLGQQEAAGRAFAGLARRYPDNDWTAFEVAAHDLRQGDAGRARRRLERLAERRPSSAALDAWLDYASGREPIRAELEAIAAEPVEDMALFDLHLLADLARDCGWPELALRFYNGCLARGEHRWLRCERGWTAMAAGRFEHALRDLLPVHDRHLWQKLEERDPRENSR